MKIRKAKPRTGEFQSVFLTANPDVRESLTHPGMVVAYLEAYESYVLHNWSINSTMARYIDDFVDGRKTKMSPMERLAILRSSGIKTAEQILSLALARKKITPRLYDDIMACLLERRMAGV